MGVIAFGAKVSDWGCISVRVIPDSICKTGLDIAAIAPADIDGHGSDRVLN